MTSRDTKVRRQIAALRQMTVERGCTLDEAATARRFVDELEASLGGRGRHAPRRATSAQIDAILHWRPGRPLPDLDNILAVLDDYSIVDGAPEKHSRKLDPEQLEMRVPAPEYNKRGQRPYRRVRCSDCERRPPVWGCSDEMWRCTPCAKKAGYPTTPRTCAQCGAEERVQHGYSNLSPHGGFCTDCLNRR